MIQSSSVTTVLVVGFISAGVMTLTQSVGVIMGANIGTTVTCAIVSLGHIGRGERRWMLDRDALLDLRGNVIGYLGERIPNDAL